MATYNNCTIIYNYNYQTNENDDFIEEIDDEEAYHNVRWKQFRETHYSVSTDGRVKNDDTGKILKPRTDRGGYLYVSLCKIGEKPKNFRIHRLVAECFLPNPDHLKTVDHLNFLKSDNRVENLRWASMQTQIIHRRKRNTGDNTTEVSGVRCSKRERYKAYIASIRVNGKKITKSFAIGKYGRSEALRLASEWRKQQEAINPAYIEANN